MNIFDAFFQCPTNKDPEDTEVNAVLLSGKYILYMAHTMGFNVRSQKSRRVITARS